MVLHRRGGLLGETREEAMTTKSELIQGNGLCGLCGHPLDGYVRDIKLGLVHQDCMVLFFYGVRFRKPDGSVIAHNTTTCGLCEVQYQETR